jgi:hypothetical protein
MVVVTSQDRRSPRIATATSLWKGKPSKTGQWRTTFLSHRRDRPSKTCPWRAAFLSHRKELPGLWRATFLSHRRDLPSKTCQRRAAFLSHRKELPGQWRATFLSHRKELPSQSGRGYLNYPHLKMGGAYHRYAHLGYYFQIMVGIGCCHSDHRTMEAKWRNEADWNHGVDHYGEGGFPQVLLVDHERQDRVRLL